MLCTLKRTQQPCSFSFREDHVNLFTHIASFPKSISPLLVHDTITDPIVDVDVDVDRQIEHDVQNPNIVVPPLMRSKQVP